MKHSWQQKSSQKVVNAKNCQITFVESFLNGMTHTHTVYAVVVLPLMADTIKNKNEQPKNNPTDNCQETWSLIPIYMYEDFNQFTESQMDISKQIVELHLEPAGDVSSSSSSSAALFILLYHFWHFSGTWLCFVLFCS